MSTQYGGLPKWNNINFSKNFMNFLACSCLAADELCFTVFVRQKHCLQLKRRHTNIRANFLKQNWFRNSFTCSLVLLDFVGGGGENLLLPLPFPSSAHAAFLIISVQMNSCLRGIRKRTAVTWTAHYPITFGTSP